MAYSWTAPEDALNRLFRRCYECPSNVTPSCPDCPTGTQCSLQPQTCNSCAAMVCIATTSVPGLAPAKQSTPIGPIVGGVVGGVLVLVALLILARRYNTRRKKRADLWVPPEKTTTELSTTTTTNKETLGDVSDSNTTTLSRTHSIASTVMTRASNVIQIAYIPGVTVRSTPQSPEIAPPMPSIPAAYVSHSANTTPDIEQHFFMPKDLRDSVWSDASSMMTTDPRISIAPSLARTTMYEGNVEVPPVPAQYAYVAQASAVSVRSGSTTPNIAQTATGSPPVPKAINISGSSIVARNVVAKPIELKKTGSTSSGPTLGASLVKKSASRRATPVPTISDEKEVVVSSPSSTIASEAPLLSSGVRPVLASLRSVDGISVSALPATIPADGPLGTSVPSGRPTTAYTQAMIHEAMFRATQDTSPSVPSLTLPKPDLKRHDSGPFSDANEIK